MRRRKRRILAAGMVVVITCSSYGSVPRVYANTNFYQIREIESLSEQVLYQKVPYGTRYQDLEMPDSIDVFVSGGQTEDVPDAGSDENVAAFANRTNDDAVLEKTDSEENGEKEDTEGKDTEGKDAGENSKDKSEGGEGLEKAESGSGEQGDSGKDGNSAENGDSQDENANPGNGESDEKDDSGKADSGSSGGNADLNEDGSSSNGKTDEPKEDVKTDEKTEEEIDEKEGFWRKVKVRWVLGAEESQASRYDGENPGVYLFRAELKSSNYEVDEDELPVIQITVLEEEQAKTTLEFAPLEESIADQILTLGSKESDIRFPETLTVRETTGEETTERTLSGITWKLDAENSDYSEFQGGLAPEDYFDRFDEDGEPEETEEKTWEGYDKANEEYNGAIYTYIPVIPESEEIPEDTALPEIHVQVGDAGIALYADEGITGEGTEKNPYVIRTADQWLTVMGKNQKNKYNGYLPFGVKTYIRLGADIDLSGQSWESRTLTACLDGDGHKLSGISQPLFSVLNGTVKNLILSDVKIEGTGNQGAIAQTVGNENKATIEKCYVSGSITATGSNNSGVGGLIGAAQNAQGAPLTIENCVVNADITGKGSSLAGGLIGSVSNSDVVTIKKCIAMGTVSTVEDKGSGGLVGGPGRSVTIKNSAALQEEVSTKSSKYFVDRIFGYDGDYKVHVVGEQNFAYQGMKVKYGDKLLDKPKDELENYGVSVSKTNLLTTNFWKNTIGWGSAAENWEFADNQLPTLRMKRGDEEVTIFSGTDIPAYLEATNSLKGSVKSGENGIVDAEITFKKGSSEKKVATEPDGTFSIDLADGTYTVTIKKTGYFTVEKKVTISDADPGALDFTMETNPVSMPSGQTVTGTFRTTDADTVTADGEIKLTYAGTDSLQPNDFTLSSEEDGTAYDGVTLLAVTTENGTGSIKIQFAKSLNLGSTNEKQLYVHYKGSLIGSITLEKEVNLVQLAAPADVKWDVTVNGKAVWNQVEHASGYKVQLYKNGSKQGSEVALGTGATSYDFTSQIAESGTYTFKVWATGDSVYGDSEKETSGAYVFSEQTLENVKTAAQAALQAMTVTNMTTAEEILQAVNDVITNKKIQAEWSNEEKFNLTPATDGKDPGQNGSITGTIVLSYTAESASTETKTIEINLSIAAKYAITFASDRQDSQVEAPTLENAAARTVITLPENTFKVYGMNFGGWSDGTKTYASGASYTMPEGNVTFKAVWVQDQWDGQAVVEPAKDENGYYQISTGAELAYFRDTKISNWKAKLMCDIDMGGHDFASIPKAGAEFDGCGHTIRGLNVVGNAYVGLFREISSDCEIKNLTIKNAVVKASGDKARVGILVGDVYDSLTVENCYVSGTIETTDGTNKIEAAGGLIGNVREKYSVEIQSCYADAEIKGTASKRFVGGLVGWTGGTTTIDNSYAVVDMDVDKGDYIGGLVGCGSDSKVTISHSYAAGEALTKNPTGAAVAGISSNGSISSCVSIFPEMRSLNRIGGKTGTYQGNYGFAGTVARKSDGTILTPDPNMMGADKQYGANATEAELKDPDFYKKLGWDFDSTWTIDSTGGYAFPILKNQTLRPNLTLDLTPSVTGITLDKTSETIYPGGSVQLTATVDVANGASREVTWKSSDPAVKVEDGLVTAADVANGTYTITATSKADPSKWAECQLTVDTAEHTVTVGRDVTNKNSPNAVVKAYASLNGAINGTNPISTTGGETGTFTFSQKAGETVYLAFTGLDPKDVVSEVTITGENNSKVNATICNLENPTVYCFTMPCSDASVQVSYAENMNAYQYTWFVGQEWGTWGTTAAFETQEWSGESHIGSLKVTKIINGKLFKEFKIKSMSLYKKGPVTPKQVNSRSDLMASGDYCIEKDNTTGLPTLYVYLNGPGMVAVDIEVKDDPTAVFSITKKPESSSYYKLDKITAKAGDLVTATLTDEGVRRMKENPNKNACLTYSGGLLIVIYPPKFTESGGKWTASFNMPAQNIETNVYFGDKDKVTLNGTDKEVDYDGTPKSVGDEIQATIGGQDLSEQFQGQYEVYYEGVNGTVYSSKTPPTNAGTYSCTVKLPDSNVYYMSNPITVQLTIKKIATKTPKAAQAAAWTDTSVTLEAPSAFVDGTAIPAGYELEYCVDQGEWQDSPVFTGLTPETTYNFYVRLKEGVNTMASAASEAVTVQTKKASSDPSNPTKPNPSNPNPSTPGNPQGTTTSGRDRSTSTWVKESAGWRYRLSNGTYLSGSLVLDPATGRQVEQVVWKQLRGAWWAFGADGYIRTGWVYDYSAGKWYYVDENTGMRTGWYLDPQDGRWYYLDPATGEMLTEWQLIPDLGYVYLNPYAPQPTWSYDEALKTWVYMEGAGRPYGSLYMAEWTPDGYYVNADGVWEPAR